MRYLTEKFSGSPVVPTEKLQLPIMLLFLTKGNLNFQLHI